MVINFVGNYQTGVGGESADETHIADSLEQLGHMVRRIPRDEWREYVIEEYPDGKYGNVPANLKADINLIAKWHHFYNGSFIDALRLKSEAPVFYWVWDSVDLGIAWHKSMAQSADLYLSGELGRSHEFLLSGINYYYFQFDCVDGRVSTYCSGEKEYDVVYLGSCDNQNGRIDLLKEINKEVKIVVFGERKEDWQREGFDARGSLFGEKANEVIGKSKVILGTSCDPHLYGYWSNRVGRVLRSQGYLLQQYTPGMENFLHDWVDYFSTAQEAISKINKFVNATYPLNSVFPITTHTPTHLFTSQQKVKELMIMVERYLKEDKGKEWKLP